ncbi:MAG: type II toxin-antitoxin system VapC family toxin [Paracoccus denitrificans]|uniref:Ribonuclease VapC n=1 Tax=Paracoccus denitrificans TaxID=266 RepID=A0A533I4J0_PARDE|nr:MAG: type II toxin-antitoxin system VapC family toxin [Paracoccus denitrificans]
MSDAVAGPVSGPCVVDASTALKWVLQEEGSVAAVTLLDGRPLYAPPLIYIEVANALWSAVRRQRLLPEEAADALDLITRAPLRQAGEDASLAARALQLSLLLDHPVYDCSYLALAIRHKVPVVTADRRFVRAAAAVAEAAPFVRLLSDSAAH